MTTLMIPYKNGLDNGVELRYSLRSVEKHLHMGDLELVLIGDLPTWLTPDHVLPGSEGGVPNRNVMSNVLRGSRYLQEQGISEALYMDDDYFLLDHAESVYLGHWGPLADHVDLVTRNHPSSSWYTAPFKKTLAILNASGLEASLSYELHRPMPLRTSEVVRVLEHFEYLDEPGFWRSAYGNLADHGIPTYQATEGAYWGGNRLPIGVPWLSSTDVSWSSGFGRRISKMFPAPSRWER